MDCMGDEFLTSPGFSEDQHGSIRCCNALHLFQDKLESRTAANDLLESPGPTVLINRSHRFGAQNLPELPLMAARPISIRTALSKGFVKNSTAPSRIA